MKYKHNKQQGIALLMSLIMLLIITIIGLASVRVSKIDTQTAGNSMFSLMVYQGAESALGRVVTNNNIENLRGAALLRGVGDANPVLVPDTFFNPAEIMNGAALTTTAQVIYEGNLEGPVFNTIPNSTDFIFQIYRTTATSQLDATGARAIHAEGIAVLQASN